MATPLANRHPQENSSLSHISNPFHTAGAIIVAHQEVKRPASKYTAPLDDVSKTSCKICERARVVFDDADMDFVSIPNEAICRKAYGEWAHNGCEKIMQPYQKAIIKRIKEDKVITKKQQSVYHVAFEVFKESFKPISLKLFLGYEDETVLARIGIALDLALKTVDKHARELNLLQTVSNYEVDDVKRQLTLDLKQAKHRTAVWRR